MHALPHRTPGLSRRGTRRDRSAPSYGLEARLDLLSATSLGWSRARGGPRARVRRRGPGGACSAPAPVEAPLRLKCLRGRSLPLPSAGDRAPPARPTSPASLHRHLRLRPPPRRTLASLHGVDLVALAVSRRRRRHGARHRLFSCRRNAADRRAGPLGAAASALAFGAGPASRTVWPLVGARRRWGGDRRAERLWRLRPRATTRARRAALPLRGGAAAVATVVASAGRRRSSPGSASSERFALPSRRSTPT
jgi:hypothetical protein